jgi:hypothetical protein
MIEAFLMLMVLMYTIRERLGRIIGCDTLKDILPEVLVVKPYKEIDKKN